MTAQVIIVETVGDVWKIGSPEPLAARVGLASAQTRPASERRRLARRGNNFLTSMLVEAASPIAPEEHLPDLAVKGNRLSARPARVAEAPQSPRGVGNKTSLTRLADKQPLGLNM